MMGCDHFVHDGYVRLRMWQSYPKFKADQVMAAFFGVVYAGADALLYLSYPRTFQMENFWYG